MAANSGRYSGEVRIFSEGDVKIPYLTRRILPQPENIKISSTTTINPGERLDLIANRTLGDPLLFWRLCDANRAMNPRDLDVTGAILKLPFPGQPK